MSIAEYIDHTNLKPMTIHRDIIKLCEEAKEFGFRAVCVNPYWIDLVKKQSDVKIATVVGFPLGANSVGCKVHETQVAIIEGVNEIDMVWNLGAFKNAEYLKTRLEIQAIAKITKPAGVMLKVIVEACYLDEDELVKAYQVVEDGGADCIKTSTGFGTQGANFNDVKVWRNLGDLKIKASGGIRTFLTAKGFIKIGADILGTSHGVLIVQEERRSQIKPLEPFESNFPNPCQTDDFPTS